MSAARVTRRLTRPEQKEATRARLLESAARVFARRGFHAASVEEVAEEAGFSKGAVYSNFSGKEDLFLAMVDARFEQRLEDVRRAVSQAGPPGAAARRAGTEFIQTVAADPDWLPLFLEVWSYAQRNPAVRRRLVARVRSLRTAIAGILAARAAELGAQLPVPAEQLAAMTFAMSTGIALERALDPEAVPAELYGAMLELFFLGVQAQAARPSSGPARRTPAPTPG
jgi:AcrR family transcriptional regulator